MNKISTQNSIKTVHDFVPQQKYFYKDIVQIQEQITVPNIVFVYEINGTVHKKSRYLTKVYPNVMFTFKGTKYTNNKFEVHFSTPYNTALTKICKDLFLQSINWTSCNVIKILGFNFPLHSDLKDLLWELFTISDKFIYQNYNSSGLYGLLFNYRGTLIEIEVDFITSRQQLQTPTLLLPTSTYYPYYCPQKACGKYGLLTKEQKDWRYKTLQEKWYEFLLKFIPLNDLNSIALGENNE